MSKLFSTYSRWEIEPISAKGTKLIDKTGKEYLDFTSGIGVCNLGHRPNEVEVAVKNQFEKFWHVSNLFPQEGQERAAVQLANASGLDRVFFANSGAEANEGAIKLARKATGRTKILTFEQSFHGRTFATMSATGQDKIKLGYGPMLETFVHVPFNDLQAVEDVLTNEFAAVMLEVIQGEGGIHVADPSFLEGIERLCEKTGALLIIDEIQTGIGRTGKPFAFQHFNVSPDIVTAAKGLGSGFPIGAILAKEFLHEFFGPGSHGSTFGGNPISIAAANATMEVIFDKVFLEQVEAKGTWLKERLANQLQGFACFKEIRGLGLMIGMEMNEQITSMLAELRALGLIALPAGERVVRLLPPLNVSQTEMEFALEILQRNLEHSSIQL